MRIAVAITGLAVLGMTCTFKAQPPNGEQACSSDDPPRCPDGYTCFSGLCYQIGHAPATGDSDAGEQDGDASADSGICVPLTIDCGKGSGKRCGRIPDGCGDVAAECEGCISGETCGAGHVCGPSCGAAGERCCANDRCNATETVCMSGTCAACGGIGQPCCANDTCAASGAMCADIAAVDGGAERACLLGCATGSGACVPGTDQDCASTCGPNRIGSQACTCSVDTWKCSTCGFPTGADYSCYKLPATVTACDPSNLPTVGGKCTAVACMPCGSASGKAYIDLLGNTHPGYCVCAQGAWACAPVKQWPCPGNLGCQ